MRTRQLFKIIITILSIYILGLSFAFAYDDNATSGEKTSYYNIESLSYKSVLINNDSYYPYFKESTSTKNVKAIKLGEYTTDTTNLGNKAIPHISILNRTATLSADDNHSTTCSLLAKVTVNYNNSSIGEYTTWYEIEDFKTYIYRRDYINNLADSFTVTLYYVLDNPENLPDTSGATAQLLTLDTGGATDFYFFYLNFSNYNTYYEDPYYYGDLTENIVNLTVPEINEDIYLNINADRPSSWSETSFFENLGQDNLEWVVDLQTVGSGVANGTNYRIGLKVTSKNDFVLKSDDYGIGIKEVPYILRISKNSTETVDFDENSLFRVEGITSDSTKHFNLFTKSNFKDLDNLNAGDFSDTIYLEFITGIDSNYGNDVITLIP